MVKEPSINKCFKGFSKTKSYQSLLLENLGKDASKDDFSATAFHK